MHCKNNVLALHKKKAPNGIVKWIVRHRLPYINFVYSWFFKSENFPNIVIPKFAVASKFMTMDEREGAVPHAVVDIIDVGRREGRLRAFFTRVSFS